MSRRRKRWSTPASPLIYRVHDEPSVGKLVALREFLAHARTSSLPKAGALRPEGFNRILATREGHATASSWSTRWCCAARRRRNMPPDNFGHFGLNLRRYAHFTSPIRRYADLIVHRALIRALRLGDDGLPRHRDRASLGEIAASISAAERRAMAAERETADRLIAHLPGRPRSAPRSRAASAASPAPACSSSSPTPAPTASSRRRRSATDYFRYDERAHALVGDARRGALPARRCGHGAPGRGSAGRRRAAVRNAVGRANGRHLPRPGQGPPNGIPAEDVGWERPFQRRRGAWRQAPISGRGTTETRAASMSWKDVANQPEIQSSSAELAYDPAAPDLPKRPMWQSLRRGLRGCVLAAERARFCVPQGRGALSGSRRKSCLPPPCRRRAGVFRDPGGRPCGRAARPCDRNNLFAALLAPRLVVAAADNRARDRPAAAHQRGDRRYAMGDRMHGFDPNAETEGQPDPVVR